MWWGLQNLWCPIWSSWQSKRFEDISGMKPFHIHIYYIRGLSKFLDHSGVWPKVASWKRNHDIFAKFFCRFIIRDWWNYLIISQKIISRKIISWILYNLTTSSCPLNYWMTINNSKTFFSRRVICTKSSLKQEPRFGMERRNHSPIHGFWGIRDIRLEINKFYVN